MIDPPPKADNPDGPPWLIVGQGLAGSCLGWEFLRRGVDFRIEDKGRGGSSRVAAGLINPITGKNFEPSWRIGEFHPQAVAFYESLSEDLWHPMPVLRLASSEKEWTKISSKLPLPEIAPWISGGDSPAPPGFVGAVELCGGGWLDTREFMRLSRERFAELGLFQETDHDAARPHAGRILCEGALGLTGGQLGTHRCAKGEILTVRAAWPETHIRIGCGGWMVPVGDGCFRVGSTYEWDQLDEKPTAAGRERIVSIASRLGGADFGILGHVAGIRPILRRSQPLIGRNESGDWIFNGLGSKGTLYAPGMAAMLADWILDGVEPDPAFVFDNT